MGKRRGGEDKWRLGGGRVDGSKDTQTERGRGWRIAVFLSF